MDNRKTIENIINRDRVVQNNYSGGLRIGGIQGVLTIIFTCSKLFGVIDWSWWWVFSPYWISACIVVLIFLGFLLMSIIAEYT